MDDDDRVKTDADGVGEVLDAAIRGDDLADVHGVRGAFQDPAQGIDGVSGGADAEGEVIAGADGDDAEGGAVFSRELHQPIDHFVDGAVAANGDDEVAAFAGGFLGQFGGMARVYGACPGGIAMRFGDGAQDRDDGPGSAVIGDRIVDQFDFLIGHRFTSSCKIV